MGVTAYVTVAELYHFNDIGTVVGGKFFEFDFRSSMIQSQIEGGFGPNGYRFDNCHIELNPIPPGETFEKYRAGERAVSGWLKPSDLKRLYIPQSDFGNLIRFITTLDDEDYIVFFIFAE